VFSTAKKRTAVIYLFESGREGTVMPTEERNSNLRKTTVSPAPGEGKVPGYEIAVLKKEKMLPSRHRREMLDGGEGGVGLRLKKRKRGSCSIR